VTKKLLILSVLIATCQSQRAFSADGPRLWPNPVAKKANTTLHLRKYDPTTLLGYHTVWKDQDQLVGANGHPASVTNHDDTREVKLPAGTPHENTVIEDANITIKYIVPNIKRNRKTDQSQKAHVAGLPGSEPLVFEYNGMNRTKDGKPLFKLTTEITLAPKLLAKLQELVSTYAQTQSSSLPTFSRNGPIELTNGNHEEDINALFGVFAPAM